MLHCIFSAKTHLTRGYLWQIKSKLSPEGKMFLTHNKKVNPAECFPRLPQVKLYQLNKKPKTVFEQLNRNSFSFQHIEIYKEKHSIGIGFGLYFHVYNITKFSNTLKLFFNFKSIIWTKFIQGMIFVWFSALSKPWFISEIM